MLEDAAIDDERGYSEQTGVRHLIAATLEQAIRDATAPERYRGNKWGANTRLERERARRWIADDSPRVFGFRWCCHALGYDPDAVRERLAGRDAEIWRLMTQGRGRPAAEREAIHA